MVILAEMEFDIYFLIFTRCNKFKIHCFLQLRHILLFLMLGMHLWV